MKIFHVIALCLLCCGCAMTAHYIDLPPDESARAYLVRNDVENTSAYQTYKCRYDDDMSKVHYLIDLVKDSPYCFLRNGQIAPGDAAAQLLEYKVDKFSNEIATVDDFIDKIASYSRRSGKEYYVIYDNNRRCPAKIVFHNELERLHAYEQSLSINQR